MLFNDIRYLIFFLCVTFLFYIVPVRARNVLLLVASYYFYMCWEWKYGFLLAGVTLLSYLAGIVMPVAKRKGVTLTVAVVAIVSFLVYFKYLDFIISNINSVLVRIGRSEGIGLMNVLLPVGISFFSFQAIGYVIDVYRGAEPEKNILRYALFISFYPQLVAGPIERSKNLMLQIRGLDSIRLDVDRIRRGLLLMLYGYFQKVVIADRIAFLTKNVITHYGDYGFVEISLGAILFAIQIYCDFAGYTSIARGSARVMGIELIQNFKRPYLAQNIKDFWSRWHISLTAWLTDYIYIPLGGNRKGIVRQYINIFIVFLVSGIWHGASWNFIIWGCLHALFYILYSIYDRWLSKHKEKSFSTKLKDCILTFILVDVAWIFFEAEGAQRAASMISTMFSKWRGSDFLSIGFNGADWLILMIALIIMVTVDLMVEKGMDLYAWIDQQETWFRWAGYIMIIVLIVIWGIYGGAYDETQFIYFQF